MKKIKIIFLILLIFLMQVSIAPNIQIASSFPNFILILIIFSLLKFKYEEALICVALGGILLDLYSPMYFGIYTFGFLIVYIITYFIFNKFISEQIFITVLLSFFVGYLMIEIIPLLINHGSYIIYFYSAFYTMILGASIYYIFSDIFKKNESAYKLSDKL